MSEFISQLSQTLFNNLIFQLVALCVMADTVFGCIRAVKEKGFNSCFGIDGAIRKTVMLLSLVFLTVFDSAVHIDLSKLIPAEVAGIISLGKVGTAEFFGLLYISYEIVSILKNLTLCGLPTRGILEKVRAFLSKYTTELPDGGSVKQ